MRENRDRDHAPDVMDSGGDEVLQIYGAIEAGDGEERDRGVGRIGFQHAIEDWPDEDRRESLRRAHRGHKNYREQKRCVVGPNVEQEPAEFVHRG